MPDDVDVNPITQYLQKQRLLAPDIPPPVDPNNLDMGALNFDPNNIQTIQGAGQLQGAGQGFPMGYDPNLAQGPAPDPSQPFIAPQPQPGEGPQVPIQFGPPKQDALQEALSNYGQAVKDMPLKKDQPPPSGWRKFGAIMSGIGAGMSAGAGGAAYAAPRAYHQILDAPYRQKLEDWQQATGIKKQLADMQIAQRAFDEKSMLDRAKAYQEYMNSLSTRMTAEARQTTADKAQTPAERERLARIAHPEVWESVKDDYSGDIMFHNKQTNEYQKYHWTSPRVGQETSGEREARELREIEARGKVQKAIAAIHEAGADRRHAKDAKALMPTQRRVATDEALKTMSEDPDFADLIGPRYTRQIRNALNPLGTPQTVPDPSKENYLTIDSDSGGDPKKAARIERAKRELERLTDKYAGVAPLYEDEPDTGPLDKANALDPSISIKVIK